MPQPEARETKYLPASLGNYTCARCDIEFPYKNTLNSHRLNKQASFPLSKPKPLMEPKSCKHEANPSRECEVPGESVDNVDKHTEKIHEGIGKPCTICKETFTISKMKRHLRSMHETPRNTCEACRHTQRKSPPYNQIIKTKNDNIKDCPFCHPMFQTKDVLKDPVTSIHVKKQNFSCEDCQRAVKYRTGLLRHMKWHEY